MPQCLCYSGTDKGAAKEHARAQGNIEGVAKGALQAGGIRLSHGLDGMFYQVDCSTSYQLPDFVLPIA